jgi:hypothetical protein
MFRDLAAFMDVGSFWAIFLTVTFIVHGIAFTVLGFSRGRSYYFLLSGTFTFLTAIYLMKFEGWTPEIPGSTFPVAWLLRSGAILCTLLYLRALYNEDGSWLWRLRRRF